MKLQPYLFFDGRCEEALEFYKKALDAKVTFLMRFKDSPEPSSPDCPPASPEQIMHASVEIGDVTFMASDGMGKGKPVFQGISLALSVKSREKAESLFQALLDGGQVQMPLTRTFFSPAFGMLADRFGVSWMIMAEP